MNMRINIENSIRNMRLSSENRFVLDELLGHLRQLRDEVATGNLGFIEEFFNVYCFGDNQTSEGVRVDLKSAEHLDGFVKRYFEVLNELEIVRKRRDDALQIAEERRDRIYDLEKRLDFAERKAEAHVADWMDAKHEFGNRIQEEVENSQRLDAEQVGLTDKILKQEAVIEEMAGDLAAYMLRHGIMATHEDCTKCETRGFEKGVPCEECGGVGRKKLDKPVRK